MALATATAYTPPAHPWSHGGLVRARVTATAFVGDERAAAAKGLRVVACYSGPGGFHSVHGASAAEAAGHALAGLGLAAGHSTPRGRHGRDATAAAQAGLRLSVAGLCAHQPPPRVLTVVRAAGNSAPMNPGDDDDDDDEQPISWSTFEYRKAVEDFEHEFRPVALFDDKDLVFSFKETADKGIALFDNAMTKSAPFSISLQDMVAAATSLRRVSMQANQGYVLASSVVEATNAVDKLMYDLNPDVPLPPYPTAVPYVVFQDEITPYFRSLLVGFSELIDAACGNK